MQKNELLNQSDVLREKFNAHNFLTEEVGEKEIAFSGRDLKVVNQFLFYFMPILQLAFEMQLISQEQRNSIANFLGRSIEELSEEDPIRGANYLYVITLWLQSMSNWEVWLQLENVRSQKAAEEFLRMASTWFSEELERVMKQLRAGRSKVISLRQKGLLSVFNALEKAIKYTKKLVLDLKHMHKAPIIMEYDFLRTVDDAPNYLGRLEQTVTSFNIEVSILVKIDAGNLLQRKRQEIKKSLSPKERRKIKFRA